MRIGCPHVAPEVAVDLFALKPNVTLGRVFSVNMNISFLQYSRALQSGLAFSSALFHSQDDHVVLRVEMRADAYPGR